MTNTTQARPKHISYADAGVDVDEGARAVEAIKASVAASARPEVLGSLGGFGSLFSAVALKNMQEPVLVSGTDGVGTKLALAQQLDRHTTVGQDLVAMCVDDIVACGAEPLFFLDYIAVGKLKASSIAPIVQGIARACKMAGCALVGGEMAEHPGVMRPSDYDLAGFVVGAVDRPKILGAHLVAEGDAIIGIASSGFHSNGYSLVRKVLIEGLSVSELNEPRAELAGQSLGDACLEPTTIYAGKLIELLRAGAPIKAMAHITGGGISDNLNRVLPQGLDALVWRGSCKGSACGNPEWDVPLVMRLAIEKAQLSPEEAYKTFNMGVGMSLICDAQKASVLIAQLESVGFRAFSMGRVVVSEEGPSAKPQVRYQ